LKLIAQSGIINDQRVNLINLIILEIILRMKEKLPNMIPVRRL
jgi:hypothetical protein